MADRVLQTVDWEVNLTLGYPPMADSKPDGASYLANGRQVSMGIGNAAWNMHWQSCRTPTERTTIILDTETSPFALSAAPRLQANLAKQHTSLTAVIPANGE